MNRLGFVLVIVGMLALVDGGIRFSRQNTLLEVDSLRSTTLQHDSIPSVLGGVTIVCGLLLQLVPARRTVQHRNPR